MGAGAVGTALGVALSRAGWPIHAVASRDVGRRERAQALIGATRAFAEAQALVEEVELVIVAIPDDAIEGFAAQVRMYSGQAMVHTSGALGADVLAPAMAAGTQVGTFHPLVAFADTERAVAALHGATIAIEADDQLADLLARMAETIGGHPVRLAPGSKSAYHAAAVLAAGGFVAMAAGRFAGPVLWCSSLSARREVGELYAPGLARFGLDPTRLLFARAPREADLAAVAVA
mgnify:CR=1 FL=1